MIILHPPYVGGRRKSNVREVGVKRMEPNTSS
jgi:hypothetical protein